MTFDAQYAFAINNLVVIKHSQGKFLRTMDNNQPDANGGTGEWARWQTELSDGGSKCRFKSTRNGKYLRIGKGGGVDVDGGQGAWTLFKVHRNGNEVKLESNAFPGKYIAVDGNGVRTGSGGPWCKLEFLRRQFAEYMFAQQNTVVIKHGQGAYLRIAPGNETQPNKDGGTGNLAQWTAVPEDGGSKCRFRNNKTGKYLRIGKQGGVDVDGGTGAWTLFKVHKNGNEVKLESNAFGGKYIAVDQNGVRTGSGGPFCKLVILRKL